MPINFQRGSGTIMIFILITALFHCSDRLSLLFTQQQQASDPNPQRSTVTEADLSTVTSALSSDKCLHARKEWMDLHLISIPVRCLEWGGMALKSQLSSREMGATDGREVGGGGFRIVSHKANWQRRQRHPGGLESLETVGTGSMCSQSAY